MINSSPKRSRREGGQAIVLVTLGLIAMCGMMGLAVDMGWSYFTRKLEQSAADAAALGAVRIAQANGCPSTVSACPSGGLPATALSIATSNLPNPSGSSWDNSRGTITGQSGAGAPPWLTHLSTCGATPPCALYYVSVTVSDSVPQLFSAVIGNPVASVGVRASAILGREVLNASFVATNRANDLSPVLGTGTDVCIGGTGMGPCNGDLPSNKHNGNFGNLDVTAPGGIYMASTCGQSRLCTSSGSALFAGYINPKTTMTAPFTEIMGSFSGGTHDGWINGATGNWTSTPANLITSPLFNDPMAGAGQPPIVGGSSAPGCGAAGCPATGIVGGDAAGTAAVLPSGVYWNANGTGDPVTFNIPQSCKGKGGNCTLTPKYYRFGDASGNNFGTYIFYGGLHIPDGAQVAFGPGEYIFAGVNSNCAADVNFANVGITPCPEFTMDSEALLCDGGNFNCTDPAAWQNAATDGGELLIFTDLNYPGLSAYTPGAARACNCLNYGTAGLFMNDTNAKKNGCNGNGICNQDFKDTVVSLHGLNGSGLPAGASSLSSFAPFVMWQDQGNSTVKYTSSGNIDTKSCSGGTLDSPCPNTTVTGNTALYCSAGDVCSPEMDVMVGFDLNNFTNNISGAYYQPRGAWFNLVIGDRKDPAPLPLQVISGAVQITSYANPPNVPNVQLIAPPQSASIIATALVE